MYAVIKTGGKQYRVAADDVITIEKLAGEAGSKIEFAEVLAIGGDNPKLRDALTKAIPFRRLADPSDLANAVAFFASDEAAYITGQTVSVSGGLTMS